MLPGHICHNKKDCDVTNWYDKIDTIKNILKSWQHRNLTLFGKVCIVQTVAISKITRSASYLTAFSKGLKDIIRIFFTFFGEI